MSAPPARLTLSNYEPGRNEPCICGSGLKFKKCCANSYSSRAGDLFRKFYNQGDFANALIEARRHFTWYALAHKAHTVPLLETKAIPAAELLRIDIEALSELLEDLHLCYFHLHRGEQFPSVIENARNLIEDQRWSAKIAYSWALWHLFDKEDRPAALKAVNGIDMTKCKDSEIISLYLDVCDSRLPLPQSLDLIERIIANSRKPAVRLQYSVLKALKYYLICESTEGNRIMAEAIAAFSALDVEQQSSYGRYQFAHALELYGKASHNPDILQQGRDATLRVIREARELAYSASYVADLYRLLGDCEEGLGAHAKAIEAYSQSLSTQASELGRVFIARSICNDGHPDRARSYLELIDESKLDEAGRFDLAISWALLGATSLRPDDLAEAKIRLSGVETQDPVFIRLRDRWMIDILQAKSQREPSGILKIIRSLNQYLHLKPNLFGIGVNLNRIIDAATDAEDHREDQ